MNHLPVWPLESLRPVRFLQYGAAWRSYFQNVDTFLSPVSLVAAFPHDTTGTIRDRLLDTSNGVRPYLDITKWVSLPSLVGLPATSAPVGRTRTGLPVGIQIVGPYYEDGTPIDIARKLAELLGGFQPPPAYAD